MDRAQLHRILEFYRDNIAGEIDLGGHTINLRRQKVDGEYTQDFEDLVNRLSATELEDIANQLYKRSGGVLTLIQSRVILKKIGRIRLSKTEHNHLALIRKKYRGAKRMAEFLHFVERI